MSFLNPFGRNKRGKILCPLCGSGESYAASAPISYEELKKTLNDQKKWEAAHGSEVIDPPDGAALTQIVHETFPGIQEGTDPDHRRCRGCTSLLPRQFWRDGPAESFAITVTGAPRHGKTTWLLAMMTTSSNDLYDVVGSGGKMTIMPYPYAEPFTVELMKTQFRSAIPYVLLGGTVAIGKERMINMRMIDIRGENFMHNRQRTYPVIARHLGARDSAGAFLLVEKFETVKQTGPIAPVVSELNVHFQSENVDVEDLWTGVIWTHLDQAVWNTEAEKWITAQMGALAGPFLTIARSVPDFFGDDAIFDALEFLVRDKKNGHAHREKLIEKVRDAKVLRPDVVEGLIALLFRMQLTYSLQAARTKDKYGYYRSRGGRDFVGACQKLAKALYLQWDAPAGTTGGQVVKGKLRVLPCGRWSGPSTQAAGKTSPPASTYPVWSDQILVQAFDSVHAR